MANTKTLLGFLAGAAVGALAGILLAPDKGSETSKNKNLLRPLGKIIHSPDQAV